MLYTAPIRIYDFKESGFQLHLHGDPSGNIIYGGAIKAYGSDEILERLDAYRAAIAELYAQQLGIPRLDKDKDFLKEP